MLRAPDALLRTLDRIEAAGWGFEHLHYPALEPLVRKFQDTLKTCGFILPATLDRRLAQTETERPLIANLLVTGFDGAHWPL